MEEKTEEVNRDDPITTAELIDGSKKEFNKLITGVFNATIVFSLSFYLLQKEAQKHPNNTFTQKHWEYNRLFLTIGLNYVAYAWINIILMKDMFCCPRVCHCLFRLVRKILIFYIYITNCPMFIWLMCKTFYICYDNWWPMNDDLTTSASFITNENYANAAVCWILWSPMILFSCPCCGCYIPLVLCGCIIMAVSGQLNQTWTQLKAAFNPTWYETAIFYHHWIEGNIGLAYC